MEHLKTISAETKKPIFTVLALAFAIAEVALSIGLYSSGHGAGFEGFGAMLIGSVVALIGVGPVLILIFIATFRKESKTPLKWLAFAISIFGLLLAVSR